MGTFGLSQGTRRALGYSDTQRAIEELEHLGDSVTWSHGHLKYSGTWTLRHVGTWAPRCSRHSGTLAIEFEEH